ncbi:MAG: leucine-rich repeat protein [Treponema sp.]|nr:leucine-rich repeat protein [Treponema sp.]
MTKTVKKFLFLMSTLALVGSFMACSDDSTQSSTDTSVTTQINSASGDVDLKNATISENVIINRACTVSNAKFSGKTITVNVTGVTLNNISDAVVVAAAGIESGSLIIKDSDITTLTVLGGGSNSIHLSGRTKVAKVAVQKKAVRIALEDTANVTALTVSADRVRIQGNKTSTITNLTVENSVTEVMIGGGTVKSLTVVEDTGKTTATVTITESVAVEAVTVTTSTGETDTETSVTVQVAESATEEVSLPTTVETETVSDTAVEERINEAADTTNTETTVANLATYLATAKSAGKTSVIATVTDATEENFATMTAALAEYGQVANDDATPSLYIKLDLSESTELKAIPSRAFSTNKDEADGDAWKSGTLALKSIVLPKSVEHIEALAFWCLYNLESVTLNEGLEEIWYYAFCGNTRLASINIPSTVTYISNAAFTFGATQPEVKFKTESYSLKDNLILNKAETELIASLAVGDIEIPSTVTRIYPNVFTGWGNITSIKLPTPAIGNWVIIDKDDEDTSTLSIKTVTKYLTSDSEYAEYSASEWLVMTTASEFPYTLAGTIKKDTHIVLPDAQANGVSLSFFVNDVKSIWTMLFQCAGGNIGLTSVHSCEDWEWKANIFNGSETFLNTSCYVTITIAQTGITFYKNGIKVATYDDTGKEFSTWPDNVSVSSIAQICSGILFDLSHTGVFIHPSGSWISDNAPDYAMSELSITEALTADEAKEQCIAAGGTVAF